MSACVAYITFITKVTLKFIYDTLLIYDQRLCLFHFQFLFKFSAGKYRLDGFVYFQAQILKVVFFTNSAEFWSLNGKTTRTVLSVPWAVDKGRGWSQTFESTKRLLVKAFTNNWFNVTYDLNLTKMDLVDLLRVATKEQLFQFNGALYEQTDGVAMGSPLGPLLANVFMTSIEENLERQGKLPSFYRRYVDDTLTIMPNMAAASGFLDTLNLAHSSVKFTMETESNGMLPFLGTQLLNRSPWIETKVYVKPTNSGLLLHFQRNVDNRYKNGLLRTMLDRAQ